MWLVTGGMASAQSCAAAAHVAAKSAILLKFFIVKNDEFSLFGLPCCCATAL
jgi:hypothetical protein